jgi:sulfur carrier protein
MIVRINGKETELPDGLNLDSLLVHFKLKPQSVVIEWNRTVPAKSDYSQSLLKPGDQIEIVKFMGGG